MEDIIIPSFSFYGAYIIITILLTYAIKKIIRYKPFYPYIPCIIGAVISFVSVFFTIGFCADFVNEFMKSAFVISAGAIASYDIVVEKTERYLNRYKEAENVTDETKR